MNQEIVKVELTASGDTDVLIFHVDSQQYPNGLIVNLNSELSQGELKTVFSNILKKMVEVELSLELSIAQGYSKGLYKDVCTEYIADLNRELKQVHKMLYKETAL